MRGILDRISIWPTWAKAVAVVALVAMAVAIAGTGTVFALRRTAVARPSPRPTHAPISITVSPAPTPAPGATPVAGTLNCRLPISSGQPGSGGFIAFPGGGFSPDPASSTPSFLGGLMYDRALSRWLPVPRSYVSPDGSRYAYWDYRGSMRAVIVSNGGESVLGPKPGGAASAARLNAPSWQPIEALDAGIYAVPSGLPAGGLWLFPWSGSGEQQVTGAGFWQAIGGGAAYGTASQSVPQGASTVILRQDLTGGAPVQWFSRPGLQSRVVGFDASGNAVIEARSQESTEVWLATGAGAGSKLLTVPPPPGSPGQGRASLQSVVGDSTGIWLATSDGLYLATKAGVEKASTVTGQLGGGCF